MMSLSSADNAKLAELQNLCDDCKIAIQEQNDAKLQASMKEACEKCKRVRELVPELMELRAKSEAFNRNFKNS